MAESERSARELEKPGGDWDAERLGEELQRRGDNERDRELPGDTETQRWGAGGGGVWWIGGDREGQRPRQSSGEGARAGETASRGRQSEKDREAAETMRETDTPDGGRPRDLDR